MHRTLAMGTYLRQESSLINYNFKGTTLLYFTINDNDIMLTVKLQNAISTSALKSCEHGP